MLDTVPVSSYPLPIILDTDQVVHHLNLDFFKSNRDLHGPDDSSSNLTFYV